MLTFSESMYGCTSFLQHSPIVQLNIGGHFFTTTLSTLRKHPGSKLEDLFSGQPKLRSDAEGRYFIDRDGTHFGAILEFLRTERLPTENVLQVDTQQHSSLLRQLDFYQDSHCACVCLCVLRTGTQ